MGRTAEDQGQDAALASLFEEGRRAFPGVDLPLDAFVRHVADRAAAGAPPPLARAPDLYLACACAQNVRGALEAFDRAHLRPVAAYLARLRPSAAFVDEVRQSLREKLFVGKDGGAPRIAEYDGRGALASWVRVVALRTAIDLRRASPEPSGEPEPDREEPATPLDPETGYLKQGYREAFNAALRRAIASLGRDQRELLRMHFVDGLTLDQLAAMGGVHRATVARRISAARAQLAGEARRLLQAALGARASELDSLARVMASQIDLSLPGLLRGE